MTSVALAKEVAKVDLVFFVVKLRGTKRKNEFTEVAGSLELDRKLYFCHMNNMSDQEVFPVVDDDGNQISLAPRRVCHDGKSMLLHPVVHFHLFNGKGELFLQKRASTKDLLPGKWDTSVGGHISPGESPENALERETEEELGLKNIKYRFINKYIWESVRERELVYSYKGSSAEMPVVNPDEIDEGRFWPLKEISESLGKDIFTPNFEKEFEMLNIITLRHENDC